MAKALSIWDTRVFYSLGRRLSNCICGRWLSVRPWCTSAQAPACSNLSNSNDPGHIEMLWQKYFLSPSLWWDNRGIKKRLSDPDFEHRSTSEALWIESQWTPPWVRPKLGRNWIFGWSPVSGLASSQGHSDLKVHHESIDPLEHAGSNDKAVRESGELRQLCEEGSLKEVLEKLEGVDLSSLKDPFSLYSCIIKECGNRGALVEGQRVAAHIMGSQFASSITLVNAMVDMFINCGSLVEARKMFDSLPRRDTSSWNTLLLGLINIGYEQEALELFEEMLEAEVQPNRWTFLAIVKGCSSLSALTEGKLVHSLILEAGLETDSVVGKALVHMYLKSGELEEAQIVFGNLVRQDVVTYNAIIQGFVEGNQVEAAFLLYGQMLQEGLKADNVTFMNVLKGCANAGALEQGKLIHGHIMQCGADLDMLVGTTLIDMYAKCREMEDASEVFKTLPTWDVVSWNSMIAGYVRHQHPEEALTLFDNMLQKGISPNKVTYRTVLKTCSLPEHLQRGKEMHARMVQDGLEMTDLALGSSLVDMYLRCGNLEDAHKLFQKLPTRHLVLWNTMIGGYVQHQCPKDALTLFRQMEMEGLEPDIVTFTLVLKACADLAALEHGKLVHVYITENGFEGDSFVGATLVDMYMNCGSMDDASQVFERLVVRDVVTWDTMIAGYVQYGKADAALSAFEKMELDGVKADKVSYISVIKACATLADLERGKAVHRKATESGYDNDAVLGNSLIDMYAKCGSLETAFRLFINMPHRTLVSWNAMIAGYAQHGQGMKAIALFKQMQNEAVKPDSFTFVSVLSACSHSGLVDEGRQYFKLMSERYQITPSMQHYTCIVDLLSRAGWLDEAEALAEQMPFEPDAITWLTLLGACNRYGSLGVGRRAFERVTRLEPKNDAAYVLLSQLHAAFNQWDEMAQIKEQMRAIHAQKQPGCSWIEVNGEVHLFYSGDVWHPQRKQVYATLGRLMRMAHKVGYEDNVEITKL